MLTQNFFLNIIFIILIFKYFCQCNNQNLTFSQQNSTKNIFEIKNENNNDTLIETTTENLKEEEEPAWACGTDAFIQVN